MAAQHGPTVQAAKNALFTIDTGSQGYSQNLQIAQKQSSKVTKGEQGQPRQSLSSQLVQSLKPQMPRKASHTSKLNQSYKQQNHSIVASPTGV